MRALDQRGSGYDISLAQATVVHSICVVISKYYKVLQCLQGALESSVATPGPVVGTWAGNSGDQSYWGTYTQMQCPASGGSVLPGFGHRGLCSGKRQGGQQNMGPSTCPLVGNCGGLFCRTCIIMAARSHHEPMVVEGYKKGQA